MSVIPGEVQDAVRGIHVTVVDLFGALLPGLVWFVLISTFVSVMGSPGGSPLATIEKTMSAGKSDRGAVYGAIALTGARRLTEPARWSC